MTIMLTADQVPIFWDAIKFSMWQVGNTTEEYKEVYFNELLYLLMSSKAQCFVRLDSERKLQALAVTKIVVNDSTGEKSLFINCLYGFKSSLKEDWLGDFDKLVNFAKRNNCKSITALMNNEKAMMLAESLGFKCTSKNYSVKI